MTLTPTINSKKIAPFDIEENAPQPISNSGFQYFSVLAPVFTTLCLSSFAETANCCSPGTNNLGWLV